MPKMKAAIFVEPGRIRLDHKPIPEIGPDEVLVKVGAAGMCRTDFQLLDGYFRSSLELPFPATPGHEVSGWIEKMGSAVPKDLGLAEGD